MQDGDTPLQCAVRNGHHKTVEYFIKQAKMDITQFDMVRNIDTLFEYMYSIVVRGVACYKSGWGYYNSKHQCSSTGECACANINS